MKQPYQTDVGVPAGRALRPRPAVRLRQHLRPVLQLFGPTCENEVSRLERAEHLDAVFERRSALDRHLLDGAAADAVDVSRLGRLYDRAGWHEQRGRLAPNWPEHFGEHAGCELVLPVLDIELHWHGAGFGVDRVRDAPDDAVEPLSWPRAHDELRFRAFRDRSDVGLRHRDRQPQTADGLHAQHRCRVRARPRPDERAGIHVALGDDAVERRAYGEIAL